MMMGGPPNPNPYGADKKPDQQQLPQKGVADNQQKKNQNPAPQKKAEQAPVAERKVGQPNPQQIQKNPAQQLPMNPNMPL